MDEFVSTIRHRAAQALRQLYNQEMPPRIDPILALIAFLLDDEAGGVTPQVDPAVTTQQWLTWSELLLLQHAGLSQTMTLVLERERMDLPTDLAALRNWAACLVLSTLDQIEMQ